MSHKTIALRVHLPFRLTITEPPEMPFFDRAGVINKEVLDWLKHLHRMLRHLEADEEVRVAYATEPMNIVQVRIGTTEDGHPTYIFGWGNFDDPETHVEMDEPQLSEITETEESGPWVCSLEIQELRLLDRQGVPGENTWDITSHKLNLYYHDFRNLDQVELLLRRLLDHLVR